MTTYGVCTGVTPYVRAREELGIFLMPPARDRDSCHFSAVCSRSTGPRAAAVSPDGMRDENNSHKHTEITDMYYHT